MMIPFFVILIPVFYITKQLGWLNNYRVSFSLVLSAPTASSCCANSWKGFRMICWDAARIDGASEFRIYWQVILPLTTPALATLGVFMLVGIWNAFLWPLLVAQSPDLYTVPLALNSLRTYGAEDRALNLRMAGTVLSVIPTIIVFAWLQRFFTRGIALTGLKG